jgi:CRP-like cAMP-binding protein
VHVVQPGQCFGELALVHPGHRQVGRVCALEPVEALVLHRADFDELRREHRGIDRMLVAVLAEGLARASTLAVELLLPADVRLWRRLAELADGYGEDPIQMSQDQLAHVAGTVRQTANRVLQAGVRLGVLTIRRGSVIVVDRAALEQLGRSG